MFQVHAKKVVISLYYDKKGEMYLIEITKDGKLLETEFMIPKVLPVTDYVNIRDCEQFCKIANNILKRLKIKLG